MNLTSLSSSLASRAQPVTPGVLFATVILTFQALTVLLAVWSPLELSFVTVFLFAAPHNSMEARYFLQRMPARWGKLRGYFSLALGGVVGLSAAFIVLSSATVVGEWSPGMLTAAWSSWNTLLVFWITSLIYLRSQTNPRRDWSWTLPVAAFLIGVAWIVPNLWGLALVYLHPLIGFWILDRELRRVRPEWVTAYHWGLTCLPIFLGILWSQTLDASSLSNHDGRDVLATLISQHAGTEILPMIPARLLVTTYTFLEMLHYAVWLAAIPVASLPAAPWKLDGMPLARRSPHWQRSLKKLFVIGAVITVLFWVGFLVNYPLTRSVYFTLAIVHVLAEIPFFFFFL